MAAKVLVIDDTQAIRDGIVTLLRCADFDALAADDGESGLALAREWVPDLIVCDILMPGMDGYEVLSRLRAEETTATIPVIFLTAKTARDDLRKGMDLGAAEYVRKPCPAEELLDAVRRCLKRHALIEPAGKQEV